MPLISDDFGIIFKLIRRHNGWRGKWRQQKTVKILWVGLRSVKLTVALIVYVYKLVYWTKKWTTQQKEKLLDRKNSFEQNSKIQNTQNRIERNLNHTNNHWLRGQIRYYIACDGIEMILVVFFSFISNKFLNVPTVFVYAKKNIQFGINWWISLRWIE